MTKDEALKLALEVMRNQGDVSVDEWIETEKAIKEALAQPEQEPLGFMNAGHVHEMQQGRLPYGYVYPKRGDGTSVAVYTTPPQRKPLSDEEIQDLLMPVRISGDGYYLRIARAIEAAHGIKGEA
jgi:division protein CdvB (Snf7/Vps24/ESCRT-III family)